MDQRISRLESDISVLAHTQKALGDNFRSLEQEVKVGFTSLKDDITTALSRMDKHIVEEKARKPIPYREMVSLSTHIGTLVIMLCGAIFFLIESRVAAAVNESSAFVQEWKKDGRLYVTLVTLQDKVNLLEKKLGEAADKAPPPPPAKKR